jgi:hypothetical protein
MAYKNDTGLPSVTEIMGAVYRQHYWTTQFHLDRGTAVHACCAALARKIPFINNDDRISGQIEACRKVLPFLGEVLEVEKRESHNIYQFTGQPDLICGNGKKLIVDWKASFCGLEPIQLGGYGLLTNIDRGVAIQLKEDGTFKMSDTFDLRRWKQAFLNTLGVYGTMVKLNLTEKGDRHE